MDFKIPNLEKLLNLINAGIFILDKEQKVIYWNNWLYLNTGISEQNALGKGVCELFSMSESSLKTYERLIKTSLKLNSPSFFTADGNGYLFPIEIKQTSQMPFHFMQQDVTILPYEPQSGQVTVIVYDQTALMSSKEVIFMQSNYDSLTGLPNRNLLFERLDLAFYNAKRKNKKFAVLYIDIDKFKQVNDTYGHDMGDEILKTVTTYISSHIRKNDTLARLGGDEFVAIIDDLDDEEVLDRILDGFVKGVNKPMKIKNLEITPSVSVGAAVFPTDAQSIDTMLKSADIALYEAKKSGRNNFKFFNNRK